MGGEGPVEQEYLSRTKLEENATLYAESTAGQARVRADYLIFLIGRERVAVDLRTLDEISEVTGGIGLPETHPSILGLISLRGETVILFDLPSLTGSSSTSELQSNHRVLVFADDADQRWAFLVERIEGVASLETSSFQLAQDRDRDVDIRSELINAIAEHDDRSLALLNIDALVELARECL